MMKICRIEIIIFILFFNKPVKINFKKNEGGGNETDGEVLWDDVWGGRKRKE